MTNQFIKIADPEVAAKLLSLGFQYIKEGDTFVFANDNALADLIKQHYSAVTFVQESKLRF